jgi:hypothetical protein
MEFTSKNEVYEYLRENHKNGQSLNEEELNEVKKFFSEEELTNLSFARINMDGCFRHHLH